MVADEFREEYKACKEHILERLRKRPDFDDVDLVTIEQVAILYADWRWIENLITENPDDARRHTSALRDIHDMLNQSLDRLGLSYVVRRKIGLEVLNDSELSQLIKKLNDIIKNQGTPTSK